MIALLALFASVFFLAGAFCGWFLTREPDPWTELERKH